MRTIALISGGKDSCFNMMCCIAEGHEIVALANLRPEDQAQDELDSYMYQTVGHMAVDLYAEAMDLQLFSGIIHGSSLCTGRDYEPNSGDEVEDLYQLLLKIKDEKNAEAVSVGAILSDYQRVRVENVCERLGLTVLALLWRRNQEELLQEMIACGVRAKIIKVAAMGLNPEDHLGLDLEEIFPHLLKMHSQYGLNVCGEGGEYETFVYDSPLFKKEIVIKKFDTIIHSDDAFAKVGYLNLTDCFLKDKDWDDTKTLQEKMLELPIMTSQRWVEKYVPNDLAEVSQDGAGDSGLLGMVMCVPEIHSVGDKPVSCTDGLNFIVSGIRAFLSEGVDISGAVLEAMSTFQSCLNSRELTFGDIVSVSLYVGDMANFLEINKVYKTFFSKNPPVRLCIQANLPRNIALQLDCQGRVKDANQEGSDRDVMHVQSLSHWAPANIGPYSQAIVTGNKLYLAGIVPLVPATLEVVKGGIEAQCSVALQHVQSVITAVRQDCSLWFCPLAVCFLTKTENVDKAEVEWTRALQASLFDDKPKMTPRVQYCIVPALPKGVLVEWQMYAWPEFGELEVSEISLCKQFESYTINTSATYCKENPELFSCHITIDLGSLKDYKHIDTMLMVKELLEEYYKVLEKGCIIAMTPLIKIFFSPTVFNYGILHRCESDIWSCIGGFCKLNPPVVSLVPVDGLRTRQQVLAWCQ
ncbi:unnamed protein product [Lymnaea stagnalis]|uniref:Diphthine--ammonia ligase n=1 Tax=Lymnaea stagnalis TaxID=6523 RepID=A0AAV2H0B0_LYMST